MLRHLPLVVFIFLFSSLSRGNEFFLVKVDGEPVARVFVNDDEETRCDLYQFAEADKVQFLMSHRRILHDLSIRLFHYYDYNREYCDEKCNASPVMITDEGIDLMLSYFRCYTRSGTAMVTGTLYGKSIVVSRMIPRESP